MVRRMVSKFIVFPGVPREGDFHLSLITGRPESVKHDAIMAAECPRIQIEPAATTAFEMED